MCQSCMKHCCIFCSVLLFRTITVGHAPLKVLGIGTNTIITYQYVIKYWYQYCYRVSVPLSSTSTFIEYQYRYRVLIPMLLSRISTVIEYQYLYRISVPISGIDTNTVIAYRYRYRVLVSTPLSGIDTGTRVEYSNHTHKIHANTLTPIPVVCVYT